VEAHEEWQYDEGSGVQRLERLIALCPACHEVKHIGRTTNIGRGPEARQHLANVNGWTRREAGMYVAAVMYEWAQRSKRDWRLDLSALADYGIEPPTAAELVSGRKRSAARRNTAEHI
jgi:hypothetical protein